MCFEVLVSFDVLKMNACVLMCEMCKVKIGPLNVLKGVKVA